MSENPSHSAQITEAFEFLGDWEQRYQFLIELGERLPTMDARHRHEANQVHGCVSKVWLIAERDEADPTALRLFGDSDNSTVKGLVAILLAIYSGHSAQQMLTIDADEMFDGLGLYDHLSPTRHVGVYAMVEKIKSLARDSLNAPGEPTPLAAAVPLTS
jgi:cysteine desulfuration protein SufE